MQTPPGYCKIHMNKYLEINLSGKRGEPDKIELVGSYIKHGSAPRGSNLGGSQVPQALGPATEWLLHPEALPRREGQSPVARAGATVRR